MHALSGGLQGLGASISQRESEAREARGLALREAYLVKRLDTTLAARATEGEATREHRTEQVETQLAARATEGEATREHQTGLTELRIDAGAAEGALTREHRTELTDIGMDRDDARLDAQITARATEGSANRRAAGARLDKQLAAGRDEALTTVMQRLGQAQEDLTGQKRTDTIREIISGRYMTLNPDTSEIEADPATISTVMGIFQDEGKLPEQIRVSGPDILESSRKLGIDVDEAAARLRALWFQVPDKAVSRARRLVTSRDENIHLDPSRR